MPEGIIINVYVNTSQYNKVYKKLRPHFTLTLLSFHTRDKLVMPVFFVQEEDGIQDSPYNGFHGIDKVIEKYGNK